MIRKLSWLTKILFQKIAGFAYNKLVPQILSRIVYFCLVYRLPTVIHLQLNRLLTIDQRERKRSWNCVIFSHNFDCAIDFCVMRTSCEVKCWTKVLGEKKKRLLKLWLEYWWVKLNRIITKVHAYIIFHRKRPKTFKFPIKKIRVLPNNLIIFVSTALSISTKVFVCWFTMFILHNKAWHTLSLRPTKTSEKFHLNKFPIGFA